MTRFRAASYVTGARQQPLNSARSLRSSSSIRRLRKFDSRRAANYQTPTRHHVRDDVFEDHYKTFQFPTADEPVVRVVEGFDLQSWLTGEAAQR